MNTSEISHLPSLPQRRTGQSSVSGVSVIIPVHNAATTLEATLHSLIQLLVAERIGGVANWDSAYGEAAPLLSWQEVHALQDAGIEFGCHSAMHWPMTGMSLGELTEDTARSRAILEEGLGVTVNSLAYPYGAENEFVRRTVADLGFQAAVTCNPGISRLGDDPLRLRRIDVPGGCTPGRLLGLV
jgi:peptidoglycan/xylan/chitin deacetylase (PgdA/CDA1 family)